MLLPPSSTRTKNTSFANAPHTSITADYGSSRGKIESGQSRAEALPRELEEENKGDVSIFG
jgi:hypothetical protein